MQEDLMQEEFIYKHSLIIFKLINFFKESDRL